MPAMILIVLSALCLAADLAAAPQQVIVPAKAGRRGCRIVRSVARAGEVDIRRDSGVY